jgi:hypothetical protein
MVLLAHLQDAFHITSHHRPYLLAFTAALSCPILTPHLWEEQVLRTPHLEDKYILPTRSSYPSYAMHDLQ